MRKTNWALFNRTYRMVAGDHTLAGALAAFNGLAVTYLNNSLALIVRVQPDGSFTVDTYFTWAMAGAKGWWHETYATLQEVEQHCGIHGEYRAANWTDVILPEPKVA